MDREKNVIGQRVRMTEEGRKNGLNRNRRWPVYGTIVGWGLRYRHTHPRVLVDGRKTPDTYHPKFWEQA